MGDKAEPSRKRSPFLVRFSIPYAISLLPQQALKYGILLHSLSTCSPSHQAAGWIKGRSIEGLSSLFHSILRTVYHTLGLPAQLQNIGLKSHKEKQIFSEAGPTVNSA